MKQKIISIILVIVLLAGLSLLLYPTVSDYFNTVRHRRAIFNYVSATETLDDETYEQILADAEAYNAKLAANPEPLMQMTETQRAEYDSLLNVANDGIMGYISAEKADIYLPIYHGSSDAVMQVGVGHIEGSSLPVGGQSAHTMLSAHRGLPSAKLFTNLDKLQIGDTFTLHVLNEAYTYEVDQILVVEPQEVQDLEIEPGHDYCTLITCTPYGVNSHRMLVRGVRKMIPEIEEKMAIQSGARYIETIVVIGVVEVPVLVITVIVSVAARRRRIRKFNNRGESL